MFLREKVRKKDGKTHRSWSVVESRRVGDGRVLQRQVLHLGELNDSQRAGWVRAVEALDGGGSSRQLALFPSDRERLPEVGAEAVRIRLDAIRLLRPRQWGGCWLALRLWEALGLDGFWGPRLAESRKGTRWLSVLKTLACHRLLEPGSEWRLHREWFDRTAMADLLGEGPRVAAKNTLYRCLDRLVAHRDDLFAFLRGRWEDMFGASFDVLLYDLTSTYFECDPPHAGRRRHGYSRDHRPDCVQVVIALVVTPEGFPLAYEVFDGNTAEPGTLKAFLERVEGRYGKVRRTWLMDRGIPTEATLGAMREAGTSYLVGTPKGRLAKLEARLAERPWEQARDSVRVRLAEEDGELYVHVESADRVAKERAMRQRRLKRLWKRLGELAKMTQTRDELLMRLGAAKKEAGNAWRLVRAAVAEDGTLQYSLDRQKLREARRREGRYLLRTNMAAGDPAQLWEQYLTLVQVEQAFKDLKGDLSIRPVYHSTDARIEAHIFVCFLAYALHATLKGMARAQARGLTPRAILDKFAAIQMVDVELPATDGRTIVLTRHTEPTADVRLLLHQLGLALPPQPPPRITAHAPATPSTL